MQYTRFDKYKKHSSGKASTVSVLKLLFFYVLLITSIFGVILCTVKIYTQSWRNNFKGTNLLLEEMVEGIPENDSRIVEFIREYHMKGPSKESNNETVVKSPRSGYNGVNTQIRNLLGKLENGLFIEAYAGDGDKRSNTLALETVHGWTGILIEPSEPAFQQLVKRNRKCILINSCLSSNRHPSVQQFPQPLNYSISEPQRSSSINSSVIKFRCFPLFSIMAAANVFHIDYLSLNVNGKELEILKTIPFDSVFIKTISASYVEIPEGGDGLRDFLVSKGYLLVGESRNQFIFIHRNRFGNSRTTTESGAKDMDEKDKWTDHDDDFTLSYFEAEKDYKSTKLNPKVTVNSNETGEGKAEDFNLSADLEDNEDVKDPEDPDALPISQSQENSSFLISNLHSESMENEDGIEGFDLFTALQENQVKKEETKAKTSLQPTKIKKVN